MAHIDTHLVPRAATPALLEELQVSRSRLTGIASTLGDQLAPLHGIDRRHGPWAGDAYRAFVQRLARQTASLTAALHSLERAAEQLAGLHNHLTEADSLIAREIVAAQSRVAPAHTTPAERASEQRRLEAAAQEVVRDAEAAGHRVAAALSAATAGALQVIEDHHGRVPENLTVAGINARRHRQQHEGHRHPRPARSGVAATGGAPIAPPVKHPQAPPARPRAGAHSDATTTGTAMRAARSGGAGIGGISVPGTSGPAVGGVSQPEELHVQAALDRAHSNDFWLPFGTGAAAGWLLAGGRGGRGPAQNVESLAGRATPSDVVSDAEGRDTRRPGNRG